LIEGTWQKNKETRGEACLSFIMKNETPAAVAILRAAFRVVKPKRIS